MAWRGTTCSLHDHDRKTSSFVGAAPQLCTLCDKKGHARHMSRNQSIEELPPGPVEKREDKQRRRQDGSSIESRGGLISIVSKPAKYMSSTTPETAAATSSPQLRCFVCIFLLLGGHLIVCSQNEPVAGILPAQAGHLVRAVLDDTDSGDVAVEEGGVSRPYIPSDAGEKKHTSAWSGSASSPVVEEHSTDAASSSDGSEVYKVSWTGSRVLALGDLHGDLFNCILLLCAAGIVDPVSFSWRGGDALLIQTGDINDRGPQGVALLDFFARLSTEARASGGKVLQLWGNHDLMNVCGDFRYAHPAETAQLGGISGRTKAFDLREGRYGKLMYSFLVAANVDGIVYSHAGIRSTYASLGLPALTQLLREEIETECQPSKEKGASGAHAVIRGKHAAVAAAPVSGPEGPLWTRVFTSEPLSKICREVEQSLSVLRAEKVVIGHTVQESGHIGTFCDGKLLTIDTGISQFVSNKPRMLEIEKGRFYEWAVPPPPTGEPAPVVLAKAAEKASRRPLPIPPLRKAVIAKEEKARTNSQLPTRPTPQSEEL